MLHFRGGRRLHIGDQDSNFAGTVAFEPNDIGIARHVSPIKRDPEPGLEEDRDLSPRDRALRR